MELDAPDAKGNFVTWVPRIAGLSIVADAKGYRTTVVEIPTTVPEWNVELVLKFGNVISGVLRAPDGSPLADQTVVAHVVRYGTYDDAGPNTAILRQPGGGVSGSSNKTANYSRLALKVRAITRADGSFRLQVKADGEVHLAAYAEGWSVLEMQLGTVDADRHGIEMVVAPPPGSGWIRFRWGTEVLKDTRITASDITGFPQPVTEYTTDAEGRLPSGWFVPDRLYWLIPREREKPITAVFLVWDGSEDLDLSTFPTRPPK
jgi:hypothetical protein